MQLADLAISPYLADAVAGLGGLAQKDEEDAKKARQAEVDEAQKKIAEIMVEAQAQVGPLDLLLSVGKTIPPECFALPAGIDLQYM